VYQAPEKDSVTYTQLGSALRGKRCVHCICAFAHMQISSYRQCTIPSSWKVTSNSVF